MRSIRPETLALLVATLVLALLNVPFWRELFRDVNPANAYEWLFLASVFVVAVSGYTLFLSAFAFRRVLKPLSAFLILVAAIASYFIGEYGIVIDAAMLRNLLETDLAESLDIVTPGLLLHITMMGVLPAVIVQYIPVAWRAPKATMRASGTVAVVALVIAIAAVASFSMNYTSVFREHRKLRLMLAPYNVFAAFERLTRHSARSSAVPLRYGEDARQRRSPHAERRVTVLVVGETARAANFSLNGYDRQTNRRLADHPDLINFGNVTSCGTSTAESLPCMFSGLGRQRFGKGGYSSQEGLLDILQRAGVAVLWRDNQSGCKGVCARVPTEQLSKTKSVVDASDEAYDEVLLDGLEAQIDRAQQDAVIVLHMMGSHGPAYYKRYPPSFEIFKPACRSNQFSRCSRDAIVNAYDNTIAYTDHVLSRLIEILKRSDERGFATAMIYVSDHGESLGEGGLYLHGLPYAIAPTEQKHVPLLIWLSKNFEDSSGTSHLCLQRGRDRSLSHDNIFHTVLGMSRVETRVYDPGLDILADCRQLAPVPARTAPASQIGN